MLHDISPLFVTGPCGSSTERRAIGAQLVYGLQNPVTDDGDIPCKVGIG